MNRKKRNLKFIRNKNLLRQGVTSFYVVEKISDSVELAEEKLDSMVKKAPELLLKFYKIDCKKYINKTCIITFNSEGDDVIKGMKTLVVKLNLKK